MLYDILSNRTAVRILKVLYDNEKLNKRYSISLKDVMQKANIVLEPSVSIDVLKAHDLIIVDGYEGETILGIADKGKKLVELLDQMIFLLDNKPEKKANIEIQYDLTDIEKKILIVLLKIEQESGNIVQLNTLTQELFPYEDYERKKSSVSKQVSKLEDIRLVEKIKKGNQVFLKVTDSGIRVIKEQIIKDV